MIPLVGNSAVLSRVETANLKHDNIALTIVQPQKHVQLSSISSSPAIKNSFSPAIRILHSRAQRRRSSVSSLCSLVKLEDDELRKLTSRGSVVKPTDDELLVCLETKSLLHQTVQIDNVNLDDSSCSSSNTNEDDIIDIENISDNTMSNVASDNRSHGNNNVKSKRSKCKSRSSKSNSKTKSKKHSKSKKSLKRKGSMKSSGKIPDVFERLAGLTKNVNNQEKTSTSPNTKKCNQTVFFNKSCGSLLEIKRLQTMYMPVNKPKTLLYLPKVSMSKSTNNVKVLQSETSRSHTEELKTVKSSNQIGNSPMKSWDIAIGNSPRKSLDVIVQETPNNNINGSRKVYLSEVQSKLIAGIPAAPPATPFPDELSRIEYIPCLMDIKSQRAVKTKLEKIVHKLKLEEQMHRENAQKQDEKKLKESLQQLKQKQRAEIYALNQVMTEHENENFKRFMTTKEADSLGV